ncbi:glutamate racemase [Actinomadura rupiterrae]|uniref:glutamate racemase n=1 Tax=Actinomadura rupiterrae TaxID=559627 RepID=UPI0020A40120|nr:aspartate/glutamate racemase family protein [Actinomadura rupiterrae]MCP2343739.1 glutamate racemase [Actinomadura rupiterrae]
MRIALIDSGFGLLAAAAAVRRARPDADLVLSWDPDGAPWGPRPEEEITERALACAGAAAATEPDALIVACNTATVHALPTLRLAFEPAVPVIGTVPAIKPAAAAGVPVAVWATVATTHSAYQADLIRRFAPDVPVHRVACPGLADAVDSGDPKRLRMAIATAVRATPDDVKRVVLGCTHYELVAPQIAAAFPSPPELFGSAAALATQTLRRLDELPAPEAAPTGTVTVFQSGRQTDLPPAAQRYWSALFPSPVS